MAGPDGIPVAAAAAPIWEAGMRRPLRPSRPSSADMASKGRSGMRAANGLNAHAHEAKACGR